jgi:hypothetical protein
VTPKQQRTTVGIVTAAFVSLLLVSVLGQNAAVQATPAPTSPRAIQDAFQTIEQHIEPVPLPPTQVSVVKPPPVAKPRYTTVCPCPRGGYGPLRGGGWWQGGPVRRVISGVFGRRR